MSDFVLEPKASPLPLEALRRYRALFTRYLKPQTGRVLWMTGLLLAGIALQLANPQVIRAFLDSARSGGPARVLLGAAGLYIAFALLQQGMRLAAGYASNVVGWAATNQLRVDLALHCLRLDMPFHKQHTPGELIERIDGDVTHLANFFSEFAVRVLGNGLLVLGILLLLFREDPWVGLGMLAYTLVTLLVLGQIQKLAVPRWAAERQAGAELYGYIEERISGVEEIRAAGAEGHALRRLYQLLRTFTQKTRASAVISSLTFNLTNLVYVIGYAAGLALGVTLFLSGKASLGSAYLVTFYIGMLADPLQSIRAQVEDFQQASASLQRVQDLFELKPQVVNPAGAAQDLPAGALAVEFADVSFRYQDGLSSLTPDEAGEVDEDLVLENVSFHIQSGRVLGILGRTGSGKSTLTRLLFRLYDPTGGVIRLGGTDLRQVSLPDLRRRVGMVTQDVQLFQASVRENLAFFNAAVTDALLEDVLRSLKLWDWVQSLPQGLDTSLAAGGQGLSAGEAQLLAFARVFLKNPGLLILDEASSRLDPATETRMERAIDRLFAGRTGVVIAHRLKTLDRADDILILENGRVVEYGVRTALAADPRSRYAQLLQTGLEEVLA
jgi:ABC-type multidrug transport system fused ATPase/permease subunit